MQNIAILLVLGGLLSLVGCDSYYHQEQIEIKNEIWGHNDSLAFNFEIQDTSFTYTLLLDIEHHKEYLYENIYCQIHTYSPNAPARHQQISFNLADKIGKWRGDCSGDHCIITVALLDNVAFNSTGTYKMVLDQYTREESLEGVKSFQLKIKQLKKR
ncbi:MAG: gliding motility lipoprotein GldH [Aureispira sp.]|nr:gliding motility lipoprotein GldH [Aureispira sp.]